MRSVVVLGLFACCAVVACDNANRVEKDLPPPAKNLADMKQKSTSTASKAELEEARRKAGFKSYEEQLAEAKVASEADAKLYIKGKLADYRKLLGSVRKKLDEVEKAAQKWADAKDAQKQFDKFVEKYKADTRELYKGYDELTGKGLEGGDTQVTLAEAMRGWDDLREDLAPDIGKQEGFGQALATIRGKLDEVSKALDAIEKDEALGDAAAGDKKADDKADKKADDKADKKADDKADKKAG